METMERNEMNALFAELAQYKMIEAEAQAEIKAREDILKAYMTEHKLEEIIGDEHKVSYKSHEERRFDSTAFKKAYGDLYEEYRKPKMISKFLFN